jgi:UDP-N-acetyl-L-fucosamine synthase
MRVTTIVGTRPELIRLSRVIARLDEAVEHRLVHTGQNWDHRLSGLFFEELGIREPDAWLETDPSSLGTMLGTLLIAAESEFVTHRPDAVLILGDTNSSLACVIARRMRIPVFHMEAGNRSFDLNIPEEVNRRLVDHVADMNLVYTEHARRNLLAEGLPPRQIVLTGSPMGEVLEHYAGPIEASPVLGELGLVPGGYLLASLHREENVDNRASLGTLLETLGALADEHGLPVVVSTHPRTARRLAALGGGEAHPALRFLEPFGFFAWIKLQQEARCVLSDSGTISEEAAILGFPAVTLRRSMERPEALDHGTILLCGLEAGAVSRAVRLAIAGGGEAREIPAEYRVRNVSERVVRLIAGTAGLLHGWNGIERQDLQ